MEGDVLIQRPLEVAELSERGTFPETVTSLHISRDDSLRIRMVALGTVGTSEFLSEPEDSGLEKGQVFSPPAIVGVDPGKGTVVVEGAVPGLVQRAGDGQMTIESWARRVSVETFKVPAARTVLILVNGASDIWCRSTKRTRQTTEEVTRYDESTRRQILHAGESTARDHFAIAGEPHSFKVAKASVRHEWRQLGTLELEFPCPEGERPEEELIRCAKSFVSFVLGRPLFTVGSRDEAQDGTVLRWRAESPWVSSADQVFQQPGMKPVPIQLDKPCEIEDLSKTLWPQFYDLQHELKMDEAMWIFDQARWSPPGIDVVLLVMALERLAEAWFKSTRTKTGGSYLPSAEFEEKIPRVLELFDEAFGLTSPAPAIRKRIEQANQFGATERLRRFFDEVELSVGEVEWKSLKKRHPLAHAGDPNMDRQILADARRTLVTLFHRVLLWLMSHKGEYIDYSTLGFPTRPIEVPAGGA